MVFLIFDLDGTIADSLDTNIKVINSLASKYGFNQIPKNDLRKKEMKILFKEAKVPLLKLPIIIEEAMFEAGKEKLKPFEGMPATLKKLKNRFNLGIITANTKENADKFVRENKLDMFDFVHSSTLFSKHISIKKVIKDFNIFEAYYVGDETRDVDAAKKAKIKSVAVTWGYNSRELLMKHNPDIVVNKPEELLKIKT
jgi:phosphoglycolate phosphatase